MEPAGHLGNTHARAHTHAENTSMQPGGCCGRDVPALSTASAQAHVHLLKARPHCWTGLSCGRSLEQEREARGPPHGAWLLGQVPEAAG